MTTTRTQLPCSAYEAGRAIVVELELPEGVEVKPEAVSISRTNGMLELRVPIASEQEQETAETTLRGFHPDAAPT